MPKPVTNRLSMPHDEEEEEYHHHYHPRDHLHHHLGHPDHPLDDQVPKPVTNRLSTPREEEALIYLGIGATVAFVLSAGTLVRPVKSI